MNAGIESDHADHLQVIFMWPLAIFPYCCNHLERCEFYPNECNHDPDCLCHIKYFHFDGLDGLDFYTLPLKYQTYYSPSCMAVTFPFPGTLKVAKGQKRDFF